MVYKIKRDGIHLRRMVLQSDNDIAGSIPRAAKIFACLSRDINTVSDIAKQSKLAKSTVHRILKLLENSYLVTEDPAEHRYYLGPLIAQLTINPVRVHGYLIHCAEDEMRRLSNITGESVTLDILLGIQPVPLFEVTGIHDIGATDPNKKLGPLYTGASGKVLISSLSEERLKAGLKCINIPKVTDRTVTDRQQFLEQVLEIKKQGYAVSFGERIPGAGCVSAPVINYTSPVCLSVSGAETRIRPRLESIIYEVKAAAFRISQSVLEIYAAKKG